MNSTRSENKNQNQNESENKNENIDRRKILRAPWRTTVDEHGNVKYNKNPIDPEYNNKYYHAKRRLILCSKVVCDLCGSVVSKAHLTRHKNYSKKCGIKQNDKIVSLLQ